MRVISRTLLPVLLSLSTAALTHAHSGSRYDARESLRARALDYRQELARQFSPYAAREWVDDLTAREDLYERILEDLLVRELEARDPDGPKKVTIRLPNNKKQDIYYETTRTDDYPIKCSHPFCKNHFSKPADTLHCPEVHDTLEQQVPVIPATPVTTITLPDGRRIKYSTIQDGDYQIKCSHPFCRTFFSSPRDTVHCPVYHPKLEDKVLQEQL